MQNALLHLAIVGVIEEFLKVEIPEDDEASMKKLAPDVRDEMLLANEMTVDVLGSFNKMLCAWVLRNPLTQRKLFPLLSGITGWLGAVPQTNDLVCGIFEDNWDLCCRVTPALLRTYARKIYDGKDEPKPVYLELFITVCCPAGKTLRRNQVMVIDTLMKPEWVSRACSSCGLFWATPQARGAL